MNHKPAILIFIGVAHLLEPLFKVLFYSLYFSSHPLTILKVQLATQNFNFLSFFSYFFLFPLAGIAILQIKRWSFPVFLACHLVAVILNFPFFINLWEAGYRDLVIYFSFLAIVNVATVTYLLLPTVRLAYTDPSLRWWKAAPRFQVNYPAEVKDKTEAAHVLNISHTGLFLHVPQGRENFSLGEKLTITFRDGREPLTVKGTVVRQFSLDKEKEGLGVEFSRKQTTDIRPFIKSLEKRGVERRPEKRTIGQLTAEIRSSFLWGLGLRSRP